MRNPSSLKGITKGGVLDISQDLYYILGPKKLHCVMTWFSVLFSQDILFCNFFINTRPHTPKSGGLCLHWLASDWWCPQFRSVRRNSSSSISKILVIQIRPILFLARYNHVEASVGLRDIARFFWRVLVGTNPLGESVEHSF